MKDGLGLVEVKVLGIPIDIYREAAEHSDELQREFALIRERDPSDGHSVPRRLLALIDELGERFSAFTAEQEDALARAVERGDATLDLVYQVPPAVKQAVIDLGALLDEADNFCRQGQELLTLATPPRAVALRRWFLDQFVRQIDGGQPVVWADYHAG